MSGRENIVSEDSVEKRVSLRDANQHFSRYVAAVERGDAFVITRRGQPVARLLPVEPEQRMTDGQRAALERTLARMRTGYRLGGRRVGRDELHER